MKKFFNVLNKAEIWLRQDPEEIRDNIKKPNRGSTEWLIPPLSLFIDYSIMTWK